MKKFPLVAAQPTYNPVKRAVPLHAAPERKNRGYMERAEDGLETRLLEGKSLDAANDPVIADKRPSSGWDPFEIWRTRVKAMRLRFPREGKDTPG